MTAHTSKDASGTTTHVNTVNPETARTTLLALTLKVNAKLLINVPLLPIVVVVPSPLAVLGALLQANVNLTALQDVCTTLTSAHTLTVTTTPTKAVPPVLESTAVSSVTTVASKAQYHVTKEVASTTHLNAQPAQVGVLPTTAVPTVSAILTPLVENANGNPDSAKNNVLVVWAAVLPKITNANF